MSTELDSRVFDVKRCIEQHNKLVKIGWEGCGEDFDPKVMQTWWDVYGDDCDEQDVTPCLIPEVIEFLKGALYLDSEETGEDSAYQNFFYYIRGLANPRTVLSENLIFDEKDEIHEQEEQYPRYLLMYHVTNLMSHPFGIVFDQYAKKARTIFSITIDNTIIPEADRLWVPLEMILEQYLDMIELEKVITASIDGSDTSSDNEMSEGVPEEIIVKGEWRPWILQSHGEKVLHRTLTAYQNLLMAIVDRMPSSSSYSPLYPPGKQQGENNEQKSMIKPKSDDLGKVISALVSSNQTSRSSFVVSFLRQTIPPTRADLKFIAPGLLLPNLEALSNQPFQHIDFHTSNTYNPILLFPTVAHETTFENNDYNPFNYPYTKDRDTYPSGLWISECDFNGDDFDDSCRLLLPRSVIDREGRETAHYAKSTDGYILENGHGDGLAAGLYQTSCNPFILRHEVELFRVLEGWDGSEWEVGGWC